MTTASEDAGSAGTGQKPPTSTALRHALESLFVLLPKLITGASVLLINLYAVRHVDPVTYGIFAFCTANLQLFDALLGSALDMSVLKLAAPYRLRGVEGVTPVERASFLIKMAGSFLIASALGLFGEQIGRVLFRTSGQGLTVAMLGISTMGLLAFRSVQTHFQLDLRFRRFGFADLSQTSIRISACVVVIAAGLATPSSLVAAFGLAPFAVALLLGPGVLRERHESAAWFEKDVLVRVFRESAALMGIACFSLLVFNQDMFFLATLRGPAQVGILRASYTIAFIPELLGTFIGQAVAPRIVPLLRQGQLPEFYRKFQLVAAAAGVLALGGGLLLTGPVITRLFPSSYHQCIRVIEILLPAGVAGLIGYPLTLNFLIFRRPKVFPIVDAILAPFMAAGYYFAARSSGVEGVAWVTTIARLLKFFATQWYAWLLVRGMERSALAEGHAAADNPGVSDR
jgi:O-antigen/teichoic acid export membrane protein